MEGRPTTYVGTRHSRATPHRGLRHSTRLELTGHGGTQSTRDKQHMGGHTANRVETQHRGTHSNREGGCTAHGKDTAHELVTARGDDTTLGDTAHKEGNTAHKWYTTKRMTQHCWTHHTWR